MTNKNPKYEPPNLDDMDAASAIMATRIANELARGADALERIAASLVEAEKLEEETLAPRCTCIGAATRNGRCVYCGREVR